MLNYKSSNCEIWGFHSVSVLLVGRFEIFKPATQVIVVLVRVLHFDSGIWEKKFEKHYFRHLRKWKVKLSLCWI